MTEADKAKVLEFLGDLSEFTMLRPVIEETPEPGDTWKRYRASPTSYIILRHGPEDVEVENLFRLAVGIPPEGLRK